MTRIEKSSSHKPPKPFLNSQEFKNGFEARPVRRASLRRPALRRGLRQGERGDGKGDVGRSLVVDRLIDLNLLLVTRN